MQVARAKGRLRGKQPKLKPNLTIAVFETTLTVELPDDDPKVSRTTTIA
jgi:hypothetical protein